MNDTQRSAIIGSFAGTLGALALWALIGLGWDQFQNWQDRQSDRDQATERCLNDHQQEPRRYRDYILSYCEDNWRSYVPYRGRD